MRLDFRPRQPAENQPFGSENGGYLPMRALGDDGLRCSAPLVVAETNTGVAERSAPELRGEPWSSCEPERQPWNNLSAKSCARARGDRLIQPLRRPDIKLRILQQ